MSAVIWTTHPLSYHEDTVLYLVYSRYLHITEPVAGCPEGEVSRITSAKYSFEVSLHIIRNTFCGTWYLPHSWVHYDQHDCYFSMRMCETALFLLPVWNLTSPSCSSTPISYLTRNSGDSQTQFAEIGIFIFAWIFGAFWLKMAVFEAK